MQFTSASRFNTLFWISSLAENERGVTRRILEDLGPLCAASKLPFEHYEPTTAAELLSSLDNIVGRSKVGGLPLIHLDLHGTPEGGLQVAQSGERVSWATIADKFRAINVLSKNNLCVVSGACYSLKLLDLIDTEKPCPFFILLAPENEILAGDLEDNTTGFYRDILLESDIISTHEKWFSNKLSMFHCERMAAVALARYIDTACKGRNADTRKEHFVSMAVKNGLANNRHELRRARKIAKRMTVPSQKLLNGVVSRFLIGKQPSFTIADLNRFVDEARASGRLSPRKPFEWETQTEFEQPAYASRNILMPPFRTLFKTD